MIKSVFNQFDLKNDSSIIVLNNVNPIDRFEILLKEFDMGFTKLSELILLALYTIDEVINDKVVCEYYCYIQDDASVLYLLNLISDNEIGEFEFSRSLFAVDYAKLIYRFTCAKKFEVENDLVNQLRINSWGREYISSKNILECYKHEYMMLKEKMEEYYMGHRENYSILVKLLKYVKKEDVQQIKDINSELKIRLLS